MFSLPGFPIVEVLKVVKGEGAAGEKMGRRCGRTA